MCVNCEILSAHIYVPPFKASVLETPSPRDVCVFLLVLALNLSSTLALFGAISRASKATMLPCTERAVASISRRLFRSCLGVSSRRRCNITAFMPEAAGFEGVSDRSTLQDFSVSNSEKFWAAAARHRLSWIRTFDAVRDCDLSRGKIKWFEGGKLNVSGKSSSMTVFEGHI